MELLGDEAKVEPLDIKLSGEATEVLRNELHPHNSKSIYFLKLGLYFQVSAFPLSFHQSVPNNVLDLDCRVYRNIAYPQDQLVLLWRIAG